jgi:2-polyprenyl-3-methyl-5-hydroxy-6-metoxy-1,4-benzoquinol methylase
MKNLKSINKKSYNTIAQQWAEHRHKSFVSQLVVDFSDKVKPKGKILDIGCGTGYPLAHYLSEKGFFVTGIDAAANMIEIAQSHSIAHAQFSVCDFFKFTTEEKFDGILAWDSFFHFPKDKQVHIYEKVGNLINPDGYLLFTHGDADGEHTNPMMGESFYYSALPKEIVCQILKDNGFEIIYVHKDYKERDTDRGLVVLAKKASQV